MKVLLGDRALHHHGNRLVARKFGKSRFKNDKMGHFRRPCVNYSQEKRRPEGGIHYTSFMKKNPLIAKRKKINSVGFNFI